MIQVIHRALDILEFVAKDPEQPKNLGDIAGPLNLNAGTCANIIKTLVQRKYLDKLDKKKGYILGARAYNISGNNNYRKALLEASRPELEDLTEKVNENSLLCVLNGNTRIALLRVKGTNDVQATTPEERPAYETTSGRLLIALLADEQRKKYVKEYGLPDKKIWKEAATPVSFEKEIKKIRDNGFAIQVTQGQIMGLAVPVYSKEQVVASLGIYMPRFRFKSAQKEKIILLIKQHAGKISSML